MTDPTAPPPASAVPGMPPPAFPEPVPLTFPSADPIPAAPAPMFGGPSADPAVSGSPAAHPSGAAPGHWPNPYQAAGHHPASGQPTGGWPQVPGQPVPLPGAPGQPYPYGAHPPPGYGPYGYVQRRTNGMAIGAMVTALVGVLMICFYGVPSLILGPIGAILGHVARRRIRQSGEDGDGMALTGIIVGWITTALAVLIVAGVVALVVFSSDSPAGHYEPPGAF